MNRSIGFAIAAMTASQTAVYIARPMTSYRLLAVGAGSREIGLVTASFALLPLFAAIPLGRSTDRRQFPLITAGCAGQVVACLLLASARTPVGLAAASALLGLGHLGVALGVQEAIARDSDASQQDSRFGLLTAGVSLGQLIGPLVGGLIVARGPRFAATTSAMLVAAGVVVVATALAAIAERGRAARATQSASRTGSIRAILTTRGVPSSIFASIAVLSAADIFTAYLPVIGEQRGIAPATIGVLLALRAAASMVSRIGIGRIVERVGRLRLITLSAAGAAIAIVGVAVVHDPLVLAVLSVGVGLGLGFGQPLSMTIVIRLVPDSARATALAIRLTGNRVGQVAAPATAALIAGRTGTAGVFGLTAATLAVSAVAIQRPALRRADGDVTEIGQGAVAEVEN